MRLIEVTWTLPKMVALAPFVAEAPISPFTTTVVGPPPLPIVPVLTRVAILPADQIEEKTVLLQFTVSELPPKRPPNDELVKVTVWPSPDVTVLLANDCCEVARLNSVLDVRVLS